jgi:uncharacterized protein (TIGR03435 family)
MQNRRNLTLSTVGIMALAVSVLADLKTAPRLRAQTPAQSPAVPQWQTDAGGKMAFDVASVKQNKTGEPPHSNIALTFIDDHRDTGGLFAVTDFPLMSYLGFAYKLTFGQRLSLQSQLPKWATTDRFDIEARAPGSNPTKDQFRLMVQSLLADRFKLAVHTETRQLPVFALVLSNAGKTGPQLQRHSDESPCYSGPMPGALGRPAANPAEGAKELAAMCEQLVGLPASAGHLHDISRNVTMAQIAGFLVAVGNLDREVLDRTGFSGRFDFSLDFVPDLNGAPPPDAQPEQTGPTFIEALREQLGLKLEATTGPVDVLVIDHIEEPSPN